MTSDFAYLSEVWGGSSAPSPPSSSPIPCGRKNIENIMDAYMAVDDCKYDDPYLKMQTRGDHEKTVDNLEGYNSNNPLYTQSFSYDSYYTDEIRNDPIALDNKMISKPKVSTTVQEEARSLTREEIYKDIIEKYAASSASSIPAKSLLEQKEYIELIIYILSGIFLIFIMEQILQVGSMLKK